MDRVIPRDEFIRLFNLYFIIAEKAPIKKLFDKAMAEEGYETYYGYMNSYHLSPAQKTIRPRRELEPDMLGNFFKLIIATPYRFENCDDPIMLRSFLDPWGQHWYHTMDDLTDKQRNAIYVMQRGFDAWQRAQLPQAPKPFLVPPAPPVHPRDVGS